jgi:hypothetical protein
MEIIDAEKCWQGQGENAEERLLFMADHKENVSAFF